MGKSNQLFFENRENYRDDEGYGLVCHLYRSFFLSKTIIRGKNEKNEFMETGRKSSKACCQVHDVGNREEEEEEEEEKSIGSNEKDKALLQVAATKNLVNDFSFF